MSSRREQTEAGRGRLTGGRAQRGVAGLVDLAQRSPWSRREVAQPREVVLERRRAELDGRDRALRRGSSERVRDLAPVAALQSRAEVDVDVTASSPSATRREQRRPRAARARRGARARRSARSRGSSPRRGCAAPGSRRRRRRAAIGIRTPHAAITAASSAQRRLRLPRSAGRRTARRRAQGRLEQPHEADRGGRQHRQRDAAARSRGRAARRSSR